MLRRIRWLLTRSAARIQVFGQHAHAACIVFAQSDVVKFDMHMSSFDMHVCCIYHGFCMLWSLASWLFECPTCCGAACCRCRQRSAPLERSRSIKPRALASSAMQISAHFCCLNCVGCARWPFCKFFGVGCLFVGAAVCSCSCRRLQVVTIVQGRHP